MTFDSTMLLSIPALVVAFTFHEYAHAKAADWLGDPTPRCAGRMTLNPGAHIDPIGFLMLWLFRFGWAKPVPVNPHLFRNRRSGEMIVSLAGPVMNLVLAFLAVLLYDSGLTAFNSALQQIVYRLVFYNLSLAFFNLLPVPPLDGSHVLRSLLSGKSAYLYARIENYGVLILIVLLWTGVIGRILGPLISLAVILFDGTAVFLFRLIGLY